MTRNTRDKIIDAGLHLFSKKGFNGATTREIAKMAGVAELTLFRHFASKENLFGEVIHTHSFLPALRDLLPALEGLEYRSALSLIAIRFLERLNERRDLIKIMHSEIHLYPEQVKDIYHAFIDEMFRTLASYFRDLQARHILRDFNPELGARAFLGMFFSYFNSQQILVRQGSPRVTRDKVIREFVDIFIQGTVR